MFFQYGILGQEGSIWQGKTDHRSPLIYNQEGCWLSMSYFKHPITDGLVEVNATKISYHFIVMASLSQ